MIYIHLISCLDQSCQINQKICILRQGAVVLFVFLITKYLSIFAVSELKRSIFRVYVYKIAIDLQPTIRKASETTFLLLWIVIFIIFIIYTHENTFIKNALTSTVSRCVDFIKPTQYTSNIHRFFFLFVFPSQFRKCSFLQRKFIENLQHKK